MTDNEESGLLDVDTQQRKVSMSDQEVWKFIESQCGVKNAEEFQQLPRPDQKAVIFNAHEEGVGPRTLSRLTGVPYTIVQRATSNKDASFISRRHGRVCDSSPVDDEYLTYFDADDLKDFPEF